MPMDRIPPAAARAPAARAGETASRRPAIGEPMRVAATAETAGGLLLSTSDGRSFRLGAAALGGCDPMPGDTLLVRVVSTSPRLEVELLGAVARAVRDDPAALRAMRPDPLVQHRIRRDAPDPPALAHAWRAAILRYIDGSIASALGSGSAAHEAGTAPATRSAEITVLLSTHEDVSPTVVAWAYPVFAWGGSQFVLGVLASDERMHAPGILAGPCTPVALMLLADVPAFGRVAALIRLVVGGVWLVFHVSCDESRCALRGSLGALAQALALAGMPPVRCEIVTDPPRFGDFSRTWRNDGSPTAALPARLFRAAAEVALFLAIGTRNG